MTRERLIGYLWPEQPEHRGRHLLSEALYVIRREIGEDVINATKDDVALNPGKLWVDANEIGNAMATGSLDALELYRGPFLDGFYISDAEEFEKWVDSTRAEIDSKYKTFLEERAKQAESAGDHYGAIELLRRLSLIDPHSTSAATRYMTALASLDETSRALQFYDAFTNRLKDEVGITPPKTIADLADSLRSHRKKDEATSRSGPLPGLPAEFELLYQIGTGSVAEVYLARETVLHRLVAIKVLKKDLGASSTLRSRFEREAQSAARIEHPNVLGTFRFGYLADGLPFIVMPYVTGSSLEDRLAANGPWPEQFCKAQLHQLASGLSAAHNLGVIHRDVRPANIFYYRDSNRPLLTDFGIAAIAENGGENAKLTLPGEQLGNAAYASPEQLRGDPVGERSDVYSLGVIACEMLTGNLPYGAVTPVELLVAKAEGQISENALPNGIDSALAKIIRRCLETRPELRPYANDIVQIID